MVVWHFAIRSFCVWFTLCGIAVILENFGYIQINVNPWWHYYVVLSFSCFAAWMLVEITSHNFKMRKPQIKIFGPTIFRGAASRGRRINFAINVENTSDREISIEKLSSLVNWGGSQDQKEFVWHTTPFRSIRPGEVFNIELSHTLPTEIEITPKIKYVKVWIAQNENPFEFVKFPEHPPV